MQVFPFVFSVFSLRYIRGSAILQSCIEVDGGGESLDPSIYQEAH